MILVEKAKSLIEKNVKALSLETRKTADALNFILAENIYSPINLPSFAQSAMDGFAFRFSERKLKLKIIGEVKAGDSKFPTVSEGRAVRIFTGAPVPPETDCIVAQEKAIFTGDILLIGDSEIKKGNNIRPLGSDIKKGKLALKKGIKITPAAIGFLYSLGIRTVKVFRKPVVNLIVTGNELRWNGILQPGEIYESNSFALTAALSSLCLKPNKIYSIKDNPDKISTAISNCLMNADLIIMSGGISVGKYDFVREALKKNKVEEIFYKVAQKPGKPLFMGSLGKEKSSVKDPKFVFALPGNPAATMVCFYEYVLPAIKKMMGYKEIYLPNRKSSLLSPVQKKAGLANFLKGSLSQQGVLPLEGQGSYMMKSFAEANAIIYLPQEWQGSKEKRGDGNMEEVEVHIL